MTECVCEVCGAAIEIVPGPQGGIGRRPRWCPEHRPSRTQPNEYAEFVARSTERIELLIEERESEYPDEWEAPPLPVKGGRRDRGGDPRI